MLTLQDLSKKELSKKLSKQGIPLKIGPFNMSIYSDYGDLLAPITRIYGQYPLLSDDQFIDFNIRLIRSKGVRRFIRPQISFYLDDFCPFKPLPLLEAFALLEWGMNWCIGAHAHQYLMIHSAVLSKNDKVVILPGDPGSGKSTLCAAMTAQGWRLLSDELALIDKTDVTVHPVCRPISLKNQSIEIIKTQFPSLQMGNRVHTNTKGDVAHFILPNFSVNNSSAPAEPALIIFPKYSPDIQFEYQELGKTEAFLKTIDNSFNYQYLGEHGFNVMADLIDRVSSYDIQYNNLDNAIDFIDKLMDVG